ncbi:tyrosine-type recombinase/integrase [Phycicoccus flavus]|uniref:tyrosine-type recombinase/integrase n=1 Tax=Phycicoccus flavus TaxID=2502783 RepID=UPI000FEB7750|nr:site-specific integrase [Phycicoccus flavus]NHA67481.1 site-specific integrase [Phycicoccus flavus]
MGKRVRGSIRRLPSGRWQVRYTGLDGLRRTLEQTHRTKAEAEAAYAIVAADMATGRWVDPSLAGVTFGTYAARWVAERATITGRTRELYGTLLRLHLAPFLGEVQLRYLSPALVRRWRQGRQDAGVGASTIAKAYRLLRSIMATAVDDEVILRNPCRIKGAGSEVASERPILTPAEVARLAEVIEPRYRLVVLLAVYGSLRWGELMGLQRNDLDLDLMTLTVRRSVSEVGGRLVVKGPKSRAGLRTIALPLGLREDIEQHLDAFAEKGPEGRLFVGHRGNTLHRSNWSTVWVAARSAADLDPRVHLHDLRHTGNHFAAASGASTRELMHRMGHASMRAALIYQHATAERDARIAVTLNQVLSGGAGR